MDGALSLALARFPDVEATGQQTGFQVPSRIGPSHIDGAGLGRFSVEDIKKGTVIRVQKIGGESLAAFRCEEDLARTLKEEGIDHIKDFGHTGPQDQSQTCGILFLNRPPLFGNHCSGGNENIEVVWEGNMKTVRATRDIEAGEEMLLDYKKYGQLQWYEDMLEKHGLPSVRQLGEQLG